MTGCSVVILKIRMYTVQNACKFICYGNRSSLQETKLMVM